MREPKSCLDTARLATPFSRHRQQFESNHECFTVHLPNPFAAYTRTEFVSLKLSHPALFVVIRALSVCRLHHIPRLAYAHSFNHHMNSTLNHLSLHSFSVCVCLCNVATGPSIDALFAHNTRAANLFIIHF